MTRSILLEDDDDIRELVTDMLVGRGHIVTAVKAPTFCPVYARRGDKCDCTRRCADILVTDHQMPGMSGIEFIKWLESYGCRIPLRNKAVMSAGMTPAESELLALLDCRVFSKPFSSEEFRVWLDECEDRVGREQGGR